MAPTPTVKRKVGRPRKSEARAPAHPATQLDNNIIVKIRLTHLGKHKASYQATKAEREGEVEEQEQEQESEQEEDDDDDDDNGADEKREEYLKEAQELLKKLQNEFKNLKKRDDADALLTFVKRVKRARDESSDEE